MNPAAIGQGVAQAFQAGQEQRRQMETRNALAAYAQNPNAEIAAGIAQHDPYTGIQIGRYEQQRSAAAQEQEREALRRQLVGRAAQGDKKAQAALWFEDPDIAMKLDDRQAAEAVKGYEFIANAAFDLSQLPPEQRPAAWDQYIQQGVQMGFDGLAQYQGRYSEQALNSIVAKAGQMQELQTFMRPSYQAVPYDSTLVNTRDPNAVAQFAGGGQQQGAPMQISGEADYNALPPGAEYIDPQGNRRVKGGTAGNGGGNFPAGQ